MFISGKMLKLSALWARLRCGCGYEDMRPIDSLRDNRIPILFFHGTEDELIPPRHSIEMARATKGKREVHLIPGAAHAASVLTDPEGYREFLTRFLKTNQII